MQAPFQQVGPAGAQGLTQTRDAILTDDGQTVEYEVPGMRPNANVLAGVASIDGYDGGVQITERWADALRRFQPDPPIELPLRPAAVGARHHVDVDRDAHPACRWRADDE